MEVEVTHSLAMRGAPHVVQAERKEETSFKYLNVLYSTTTIPVTLFIWCALPIQLSFPKRKIPSMKMLHLRKLKIIVIIMI